MSKTKDISGKLVVSIIIDGEFCGLGVPLLQGKQAYVLTAGHVILGNEFTQQPNINKIKINTVCGSSFHVDEILGQSTSKCTDLIVLKLKDENSNYTFPNILICETISQNLISNQQFMCIKLNDSDVEDNVHIRCYEKKINDYFYQVQLENGTLVNFKDGCAGSDAFKGISGAGLFFDTGDSDPVYLTGLITDIKNTTISDTLKVANLRSLLHSIPSMDICSNTIFDTNKKVLNRSIQKIKIEKIENETIKSWLEDIINSKSVKLITEKIKVLKPQKNVEKEIYRVVRNLIKGSQVESYWGKEFPALHEHYQEFYDIASDGFLEYEVTNRKEAQDKLIQLTTTHKADLEKSLKDFYPNNNEVIAITNSDISKLLAACDLNFEISDD
jgi:hypothetical protein